MEQILVGNEGNVQQKEITSEFSKLLEPSLLANMAIFDPDTLLLLILTSEPRDYSKSDLIKLLRDNGKIENNTELIVEKSLDILLDSGFFSAEWKCIDNNWERRFDNRTEVVKYLQDLAEDIVKPGDGFLERFEKISGRLLLVNYR